MKEAQHVGAYSIASLQSALQRTAVLRALPIWKLPLSWLLFELRSCTENKAGSLELAVDARGKWISMPK